MAMLYTHPIENSRRTRWWCLKCVKVYPPRDIRPFVMYCVNGKPRSSLLIESTDSMIFVSMGGPFGPAWAPRNAQRANVGPAGLGSMVNVIALKTATLVLSRG